MAALFSVYLKYTLYHTVKSGGNIFETFGVLEVEFNFNFRGRKQLEKINFWQ